jgi:hypothetical protein
MLTNVLDPHAQLEMLFIAEYLKSKGYLLDDLQRLPEQLSHQLMAEASAYASAKLTNLELRAEMVHELEPNI